MKIYAFLLAIIMMASPLCAADKPNFIFILSDDLAQGDVGVYGQQLIQTPSLDRMAREGTRYLQAYSGTTVCAPSRASLITGLDMGHSPVRANREVQPEGQKPLPEETFTVAQLLKNQGYATAAIGKWGMGMFDTSGSPLKKGFDHFFGYNCQRHAHSYFPSFLYNGAERFSLEGNDDNKRVDGQGAVYAQDLISDETIRWIQEHQDQPFFLYFAVTLPHGAYQISDQGIYRDKPWTEQQKNYAAMVTRLDSDLGRILDLLQETGLAENTLVMFSGDNGSSFDPGSEIGRLFDQTMGGKLRGFKRTMYEGGLRQAAFAWWPGVVPAGRVSDEPWAFWDYLPTVAELSGGTIPAEVPATGKSLVSYLKGGPAPERDYFYWELHERAPIQAVRWDDWKAVRNGPLQPIELYDLKSDVGETTNLADANPEQVAKAEALMQSARVDHPDWPLVDTRAARRRNAPSPPVAASAAVPSAVSASPLFEHRLNLSTPQELQQLFAYSPQRLPLVSAHRGGGRPGFPENCLETFDDSLLHGYCLFEIDPRMTKDGHVVLHHDDTLDRTTTGTGRVVDKTLAELKALRLRDSDGKVTDFVMPTLGEALEWARGKAILVLDQKDASTEVRRQQIEAHGAEGYAMMIVGGFGEVKATYEKNPNIMMEIFIGNRSKFEQFQKLGVPWSNVIPFIGHAMPEDITIIQDIHEQGASCMLGTSRNHDRDFLRQGEGAAGKMKPVYEALLSTGVDILETDIPTHLSRMLNDACPIPEDKAKFFQRAERPTAK